MGTIGTGVTDNLYYPMKIYTECTTARKEHGTEERNRNGTENDKKAPFHKPRLAHLAFASTSNVCGGGHSRPLALVTGGP
jgi:hypothetical protein